MNYIPNFWENFHSCFNDKNEETECTEKFKNFKVWNWKDNNFSENEFFGEEKNELIIKERRDYLSTFKLVTIPKGTILCQATPRFLTSYTLGGKVKYVNSNFMWMYKYFPCNYKSSGGWFTLGCTYDTSMYSFEVLYSLQEDINLIFIEREKGYEQEFLERNSSFFDIPPEEYNNLNTSSNFYAMVNIILSITSTSEKLIKYLRRTIHFFNLTDDVFYSFIKKLFLSIDTHEIEITNESLIEKIRSEVAVTTIRQNKDRLKSDFFSIHSISPSVKEKKEMQKMMLINYILFFSDSHVFAGVEGWKEKGYDEITQPPSSKKGLLSKISKLGFDGYIACDLCEIAISKNKMKKCFTFPEDVLIPKCIIPKELREVMNSVIKNCKGELEFSDDYHDFSENFTVEEFLSIIPKKKVTLDSIIFSFERYEYLFKKLLISIPEPKKIMKKIIDELGFERATNIGDKKIKKEIISAINDLDKKE